MCDIRPTPAERASALFEVLLCSGFPTQLALGATLPALGLPQYDGGRLSIGYVAVLSIADAIVLIGLILLLLRAGGERPRDVLLGRRRPLEEAAAGVPMAFIALGLALGTIGLIRWLAPWLQTEAENPLQDLLTTPRNLAIMAVVLVIAGGIREEVQRAFLMHRFEHWLGGPVVGVIVASVGFGVGHLLQGADVAIVTGLLGAFWAVVYLRRRSIMAPVVSHCGFNLLQLGPFL